MYSNQGLNAGLTTFVGPYIVREIGAINNIIVISRGDDKTHNKI